LMKDSDRRHLQRERERQKPQEESWKPTPGAEALVSF
jgi:hypothetical protein